MSRIIISCGLNVCLLSRAENWEKAFYWSSHYGVPEQAPILRLRYQLGMTPALAPREGKAPCSAVVQSNRHTVDTLSQDCNTTSRMLSEL
jgi:hypothetical protein